MDRLRNLLRLGFAWIEALFARAFPPDWNPLYHLGALGFFFFWIVAVSGIYLYIFFDTGITEAYGSIEYMTHEQWYLGGVMRSLHRYASDAMILMMLVHGIREFALGRYRGARWFTWVTGVPIAWLVFACGITGYWLVWDRLAQYVAITTSEWLDRLPIFGEPIARNFLSSELLDDRFFTLMIFIHIAAPLILLIILWIHLQRVARPKINPARGLAIGTMITMLALSLIKPAVSQGPADLNSVPAVIGLDWYYLGLYPLFERWPGIASWGLVGALSSILVVLPWLPPMRRPAAATVDLANCNGCTRCAVDCPYNAIAMLPRSDGLPFTQEAVVDPARCVSCGLCAGACPTSMPFRRATALVPGIDLPDLAMADLRQKLHDASARLLQGPRIILFGCEHGVDPTPAASERVAAIRLPCIGHLPPAFIDYVLSRKLADGVFLTGCAEGACQHRFGIAWTEARIAGERDPHLRKRVPKERLETFWVGPGGELELTAALDAFAADLKTQTTPSSARLMAGIAGTPAVPTTEPTEPGHG
ncbi:MAG: cytochrome b N-terminal domain-containing protein [Alphaproteobacteria bacterium]|nr:cytochrome b N-terminal domain-containing protein [Alphaproteobacteria bacterium]